MSGTLNGFPDDEIATTPPTAYDNFIGGAPVTLLSPGGFPSSAPACPNCGGSTFFLMQLYCPVNANDRILYFFTCLQKDCQATGRCWRVFKLSSKPSDCQAIARTNPPVEAIVSEWALGEDDGDECSTEDAWFTSFQPIEVANPVDSCLTDNSHSVALLSSPFKCRYIQVYDEVNDDQPSQPHNATLSDWVLDYQAEAEFVEEDERAGNDHENNLAFTPQYSLHLATRDPAYGCEPIRYAWTGWPIFTTDTPCDEWEPHLKCANCGGNRVFEVQLFPTLNNYLSLVEKKECRPTITFDPVWPLNFSTIIVFSCLTDCRVDEWTEECPLVQTERGESIFNSDV